MRPFLILIPITLAMSGCKSPAPESLNPRSDVRVAPGVRAHFFSPGSLSGESEAAIIDVDLATANVRLAVVSRNLVLQNARVWGESLTVKEWCKGVRGLGGVNGGFFGETLGNRKEVIGLLAREEGIVSTGRMVRSPRNPSRRIVRSVLGFTSDGMPHIGWAVGQRGHAAMLTEYLEPLNPTRRRFWKVDSAVACGPRLIQNGRIAVTDREERLVNPPPLRRTFAAYSVERGRPRRLVVGIAESMTFQDVAGFLDRYFRSHWKSACAEAMCLDGGASSQLAYRTESGISEFQPNTTTVPSAVLLLPRD